MRHKKNIIEDISESRVYGVTEIARFLKVTSTTVRSLLEAKKVRGFKVGREWRVSGDELLRLVYATASTEHQKSDSILRNWDDKTQVFWIKWDVKPARSDAEELALEIRNMLKGRKKIREVRVTPPRSYSDDLNTRVYTNHARFI